MAKKNKFLKDLLKKKIDLPKIKLPSVNLLEDTKNKINNYYTDFKKNREKEKKRAEKRKILEEKKLMIKQKKQDQKDRLDKIREEKKQILAQKKLIVDNEKQVRKNEEKQKTK